MMYIALSFFFLPMVLYLCINAYVVKNGRGVLVTISLGSIIGFLHGFIWWALFCWSEGLSFFLMKDLLLMAFFSSIVGIIIALGYVLIGLVERWLVSKLFHVKKKSDFPN